MGDAIIQVELFSFLVQVWWIGDTMHHANMDKELWLDNKEKQRTDQKPKNYN